MPDIFYYISVLYVIYTGTQIYGLYYPFVDYKIKKLPTDLAEANEFREKYQEPIKKSILPFITGIFLNLWVVIGLLRADEKNGFILVFLIICSSYVWMICNMIFNKKGLEKLAEQQENSPRIKRLYTLKYVFEIIVVTYIFLTHFSII